ncbi:MAG: sigma-70 family RNA polymerase sigma factor [Bacteroidales bacterium]|nr:sigma-70 family RNA polymerase sigma factor [Bacteroidales bacterium]
MNYQQNDIHLQWVEACRQGDRKAYSDLYQAYSKAMFNICFRMMGDVEEARDMLQEGFVEAFHKLNSFRGESSFGAWLKRIMVNRCINELGRRRIQWVSDDQPELKNVADEDQGVDEEALRLSVDRVKLAMAKLPEGARVIFSLYLIEGYDHTEIAEILKISESTSKTQFMRARQLVKEIMLSMPGFVA